ncbi:chromosome segregation protein SMC [Haloprofundus marisrubri]|uniref:Chromosome segregation protein SMC n=1 Tax=Haloprofundus marisrubri TaxID=1514971 RepID=A0A0W1R4H7_9EURY|nr:archaea-specific SMC-related protein [Haloprofundus marisrubri]KTG07759.1 chromosome segregation protein SMC [Haloprofundus marisrubri]
MSSKVTTDESARFVVKNVGGIDETTVELPPGITVLAGRNATNRTSFLQAIMATMGSERVSLKGDADEGHVELELGDELYTRTLTRTGGGVSTSGDPFLDDDADVADLFAFLLGNNEARRAVTQNVDLREIIMRPVDTDAIHRNISELETEKSRLDDRIDELQALKRDLPELETERTRLREELDAKREELAAKEAEIDDHSSDVDESREEKRELEAKLDELRDRRAALETVRSDIDLEQESIESLTREQRELEDELADLDDDTDETDGNIDHRIDQLRERKQRLSSEVSELQNVLKFNEEMLEDGAVTATLSSENDSGVDSGAVTDKLVDDDTVVCWTCGSNVDRENIEGTLDQLRALRKEKLSTVRDIEDDLSELRAQKKKREKKRKRAETLRAKRRRVEDELDRREETLSEKREKRDELGEEVEALEETVDSLESEDFGEILDLHKEANELEFELRRLESSLESVESDITDIEEELAEERRLDDERERIADELTDLRTRIEQIETQAISEFNEHMDAVLGILEYANIERIWIERVERRVREGRRKVDKAAFELHIVRSTESGTTYEDTVDHLSESEQEVTGLIFALAGYLVHDLYETVPFMLLDSLEAIDSDRIARLVDYLSDYAEFLVVALLPEDAQAIENEDARVSEI